MRHKLAYFFVGWVLLIWLSNMPRLNTAAQNVSTSQVQTIELVGQIGGTTRAVAVQGDYAYIGVGPRLIILNITDPSQPTIVGQTSIIGQTPLSPQVVNDIKVIGNYAYVAAGKGMPRSFGYDIGKGEGGLYIFNVADPTTPIEIGSYKTPDTVWGITINEGVAYIANGENGVRFVDVNDPTMPTEIGFYDTGSAYDVTVSESIAYVANNTSFQIIDTNNPRSPSELSRSSAFAWDVEIVEQFAYVIGGGGSYPDVRSGQMQIFDVTNPNLPIKIAELLIPSFLDVAVYENIAYVVGESGELHLFDVTNPADPTEIRKSSFNSFKTMGSIEAITVAGNIVYLADAGGGLHLIDVSNPVAPVEVGFYDTLGSAEKVIVTGDIAYVADGGSYSGFVDGGGGLWLIDVNNPVAPVERGYLDTSFMGIDIDVLGEYVYMADWGRDLRIINVREPSAPVQVGFFDDPSHLARDVAVARSVAYIADQGGLHLIDISNPQIPNEIAYYESSLYGEPLNVHIVDNLVYFCGTTGLHIIDTANPVDPSEIGRYGTSCSGIMQVFEDTVYIFNRYGGLSVVNIDDPTDPVGIDFYETLSYSFLNDIDLIEDVAYIAAGINGVHAVDLADPSTPTEIGFFDTSDLAFSIDVVGDFIYVADGTGGLLILRHIDNDGDASSSFPVPSLDSTQVPNYSPTTSTEMGTIPTATTITVAEEQISGPKEMEPATGPEERIGTRDETESATAVDKQSQIPLSHLVIIAGLVFLALVTGYGMLLWRHRQITKQKVLIASYTCSHCGSENPAYGRYCRQCGHVRELLEKEK